MTHEQKPESAEFRTREGQIGDAFHLDDGRYVSRQEFDSDQFESELVEAETRGAAAQRQKDAEGVKPVKWQRQNPGHGWIDTAEEDLPFYRERGFPIRPLYTRPANVAALEARVKELEGAKGRKQEEARRYRNALANIVAKTGSYSVAHRIALEALAAIREGGE